MSNSPIAVLQSNNLVERFANVSPAWMKHDAETGFALQILSSNDYLMKIATNNNESLLHAMAAVAGCGLSLNPAKREAYLVPRKGKVCFDPSYVGLCKLSTDTGAIVWVQARIVRKNDRFVLHDVDQKPTHEVESFGDRGEIVGVYCVAKIHDGSYLTGTMSIDEVHKIRNRSEAYKSNPERTPWYSDHEEMIKKTIVKRDSKMWPKSWNEPAEERLAKAIQESHNNENVKLVTSTPDVGSYSDAAKSYYDSLIESKQVTAALDMYVLSQTSSAPEMASLYNSFPAFNDLTKEQKAAGVQGITYYKKLIDELMFKGEEMFESMLTEFMDGGSIDELSQAAQDLIRSRAS